MSTSDERTSALVEAVETDLDVRITAVTAVTGGDVARAFRLVCGDGRPVFAKTHDAPPPLFFTTESTGLEWLRDRRAVAVPDVLAVDDGESGPPRLVLEWIDTRGGRAGDDGEAEFGRVLAEMHRPRAAMFGRPDRRTTGSRALPNEPTERWADFYAGCRLLPLARLAADSGALSDAVVARIDAIAGRLDEYGGGDEPPSLLHGDLWAGNRLVDRHGRSWLIDPAAHGGHREFDLAMMRLFGGFGAACFGAYVESFAPTAGWEDRVPLHQLAPLIVHAIKFGGPYPAATERALDALGA